MGMVADPFVLVQLSEMNLDGHEALSGIILPDLQIILFMVLGEPH